MVLLALVCMDISFSVGNFKSIFSGERKLLFCRYDAFSMGSIKCLFHRQECGLNREVHVNLQNSYLIFDLFYVGTNSSYGA